MSEQIISSVVHEEVVSNSGFALNATEKIAVSQPKLVRAEQGQIFNVAGDSVRIILGAGETGGQLSLMELEAAQNSGPPPHIHVAEDEMLVVTQGRFEFFVNGQTVDAPVGTIAWAPRGVPHTYRAIGEGQNRAYVWAFPAGVENFFGQCNELAKHGTLSPQTLTELAAEHGITIFAPGQDIEPAVVPDSGAGAPHIILSEDAPRWEAFGDCVRPFLVSEQTDGRFVLGRLETPPQSGPPPHIHVAEDEVFVVQSGRIEFWIDGTTSVAEAGDVLWAPRGVPHTFRNTGDQTSRALVFATPGGFDKFFSRCAAHQTQGTLSPEVAMQIGAEYGITFLPPQS